MNNKNMFNNNIMKNNRNHNDNKVKKIMVKKRDLLRKSRNQ